MKKISFCFIFFTYFFKIHALAQCEGALPTMFVSKDISLPTIIDFTQGKPSKYDLLRSLNGFQNFSFTYTRRAIDDLLTTINKGKGIRIYLARYNECDEIGSDFPTTIEDNKVILLFTTEEDFKNYYFLNEKDDKVYPIKESCATSWIIDYENNVASQLLKTLISKDDDNLDTKTKRYSDTKSIFYPKDSIYQAFNLEETYTHVLGDDSIQITGYKVFFSAYSKKGKKPKPWEEKNHWKQRLFLQFEYMYTDKDGKSEVFYLDDLKDFECRVGKSIMSNKNYSFTEKNLKKFTAKEKVNLLSIDNGQLCPTNCPK